MTSIIKVRFSERTGFNPVIQLRQAAKQPNAEPSNTTSESGSAAEINPKGIIGRGYTGEGKSKMIYGVKIKMERDMLKYLLQDDEPGEDAEEKEEDKEEEEEEEEETV